MRTLLAHIFFFQELFLQILLLYCKLHHIYNCCNFSIPVVQCCPMLYWLHWSFNRLYCHAGFFLYTQRCLTSKTCTPLNDIAIAARSCLKQGKLPWKHSAGLNALLPLSISFRHVISISVYTFYVSLRFFLFKHFKLLRFLRTAQL